MADRTPSPGFPTTRWALVSLTSSVDPQVRRRALEELLQQYLPALRAHLMGPCRLGPEEAEEVVQAFLVEKVLERSLLTSADQYKGRLRSLMLRSLENYLIDRRRRHRHQRPWDEDEVRRTPADPVAPPDAFAVAWARQVLKESLRRMREECQARGRRHEWSLFELRVARPALTGAPPIDYPQLVQRFGFASPDHASNVLVNAKRHYRRVLESVVAQYAFDEEIATELDELRGVLASAGPLGVSVGAEADSSRSGGLAVLELSDEAFSPDESNPSFWAELFDLQLQRDALWLPEELQHVLDHQMSLPLDKVLSILGSELPQLMLRAQTAARESGSPLDSLSDLFAHREPPLELLDAAKRCARRAIHEDASNLPSEITTLIYFVAIATALVRHHRRITKSDDATLQFGFERVLAQPCGQESLTVLIRAAGDQLSSGSGSASSAERV